LPSTRSSVEPSRRRATLFVALVAVAVPALLLAVAVRRSEPPNPGAGPTPTIAPLDPSRAVVGKPAPEFTLPTADGRTVRLADFRGRPVVLNFFASWCLPCEQEMPVLERIAADGRVSVVAVTFRDAPGDARDFTERLGLRFPVLLDDERRNAVAEAYGVRSPPMTFFIDRAGRIAAPAVYGGAGRADLREGLARIAPDLTPPT
jgi:cytochrome c biogenesis protein CcmG/thiol:disulfide interchange protein DsbE